MSHPVGTVYLIHLESPIEHAQHYLGFTEDFERRLSEHKRRTGAAFLAEAVRRGIDFEAVRFWENKTRADERLLKNRRNARQFCPKCRADFLERRRLHRLMKKQEVQRIDWTKKKGKRKSQKVTLPNIKSCSANGRLLIF